MAECAVPGRILPSGNRGSSNRTLAQDTVDGVNVLFWQK